MQQPDEENIVFKTAIDFINNSNHPVFLTGKAGTGKTTFLKYIKEHTRKNTIIVAPTGVAAINAGGTTIHSFFQLPFGPYLPINKKHFTKQNNTADKNSLLSNLKLTTERREIISLMELLIIDEISMVRCDVLDAIDAVLRHVRKRYSQPFGGVQVLYIGDMYQLPPVIKEDEWKILKEVYDNQFFFSSQIIAEQSPVYIELAKVYRQKDILFINLLNKVRNNEMDEESYQLLHSRYLPDLKPSLSEAAITLTTHNNKADTINNIALSKLNERQYSFSATIEGSFFENSFPADELFAIKIGAQVMFLKNDTEKIKRYYNGKIGVVHKIEDDKIWVMLSQEGFEQIIEVKREVWRNIKYTLNNKTRQVEEEELGSFTQFPLRLAWAITIHKSQGLTFKNAIIDAGSAFAPGQVYVALSRCTSLNGIILHSKISYKSLHSDERIIAFALKQQGQAQQKQILLDATRRYQQDIIIQLFDFANADMALKDLFDLAKENNNLGTELNTWLDLVKVQIDLFTRHAGNFKNVLNDFFLQNNLPEENSGLQVRLKGAADWFFTGISKTKSVLLQSPAVTDNWQLAKDYNERLQKLFDILCYKGYLFDCCRVGFSISKYNEQKCSFKRELFGINAYSGKSNYVSKDILYPVLYNELKSTRNEIATKKAVPVFMVCTTQALEEMTNYLPCSSEQLSMINGFGAVKLKQYGNTFIDIIKNYCELNNLQRASLIPPRKIKKQKQVIKHKPDTKKESFDLYKSGKTIREIAGERNLTITTIEGHLAHFIETGELNIDELIDKAKQEKIIAIIGTSESKSLQTLKGLMPAISYGELKWVIASEKNRNNKPIPELSSKVIL